VIRGGVPEAGVTAASLRKSLGGFKTRKERFSAAESRLLCRRFANDQHVLRYEIT
jgi:hypothetical protein